MSDRHFRNTLSRADIVAEDAGHIENAIVQATKGRSTFLEGSSGLHVLRSVFSAAANRQDGDPVLQDRLADELQHVYKEDVQSLPASECELMYGRAGFLFSVLLAQKICGPQPKLAVLKQALVRHMVEEGMHGARESGLAGWGLMYSWHGKHYLGAAHGLCGILHTLLHCEQELPEALPEGAALRAVETAARALVRSCFPSGNLPSSLGSTNDRLVQWCHGAPGFIPLMCKCHEVLGECDGLWLDAARRAAEVVWERGLLKKGVGLCHGISGNGYAFLSLYRCTGEQQYLHRARQFALFAAQHWRELYNVPDCPPSLYEGLAGALCFWMDVLRPDESRFPGYEL